ncbi:exodeoxyribonuclease III [Ectothiorhodospira shaposhnikovii]|uniref:exodeoxyribonuclease III n=1 Tax=Ectothiorhodospira shaposhnikovii TaxID=1054 RepID=UPI001903CFC8|nr:exodeoxyribonuclease III [Ectothiorhodospira shaposhnikovii]MBK1671821.1 exodeoxyribonuclease III [Ectothiorhodospira shaposhnikovii]
MKIATWNVNSLKVRLPHVLDWLAGQQPDVLALQETKTVDEAFPLEALQAAGYHCLYAGQKTYNGVALLSRVPGEDPVTDPPGVDDPERRILAATVNGVRVINLYVVNGSEVGSDKYARKLDWLVRVTAFVKAELDRHDQVVVLGDFNIAPEDRDVHDPAAWHERILCSTPERAALRAMLDLGLEDVFRRFEQPEGAFSWWDYRAAAFRRNRGLRIDLILASQALAERCLGSEIDPAPRRLERPSDHAPVLACFDL